MRTVYEFSVKDRKGKDVSLKEYANEVLLIVNTATKCGFTKQLKGLEELYQKYKDKGLVILGFPCNQFMNQEPLNEEEIKSFCSLTYGVTFPMFSKIDVNGENTHPLYKYLKEAKKGLLGSEAIKWNFTKFLVDKNGTVINRYAPATKPESLEVDILIYL